MECPRCRKNEFSPDGICLSCNYKIVQTGADSKEQQNPPPSPDGHAYSGNSSDEIPPWQKALAQRLESLKDGKPASPPPGNRVKDTETQASLSVKKNKPVKTQAATPANAEPAQKPKQQMEVKSFAAAQERITPQQKTIASLGEKVLNAAGKPVSKDIRDLIDSAVSGRTTHPVADSSRHSSDMPADQESKFILLSRTLSGLIDMIFIIFCTGAFVIAADSLSGIVILDGRSILEYAILFLLIFFLYSVFFLAASGQTIGMMITDLRIVGIEGSRPSIGQLFIRCFGYLLSVILLGAGLLWSFFDRKNKCFHDRFSDTSVIRL